MIIGVGIDVVDIERFGQALARTPALRDRLFTETERGLGLASLAARFAAKEALAKSLGAPAGLHWLDATVVKDTNGRPSLQVSGTVEGRADELGVSSFHLSLSHDAGIASAVVMAWGSPREWRKDEAVIEAYAVADVRAAEEAAMAGLPEGELMARAARGLAAVVAARLEERGGMRVVGLVGGGNNGGDALYALAHLAERGCAAAAIHAATAHTGGLEAAREAGVALVPAGADEWRAVLSEADVVVDGILGIGGRPGLEGEAAEWVDAIPEEAWVVAVDLPSGADPAGEVPLGDAVFADETVTFGVAKPVHLLGATEPAVGRLTVIDIGLDLGAGRTAYRPAVERLTFDDVRRLWPVPGASSDKYSRGVVGIVAGTPTYPGAAVLSVLGALGAGPGMVRYVGPPEVQALIHAAAPEAVTAEGRVQAWVCGSGFDPSSRAKGVAGAEAPRGGGARIRPAGRRRRRCPGAAGAPRGAHAAHPARRGARPAADPAPRGGGHARAGHRRSAGPRPRGRRADRRAPCCSRGRTRWSSARTRRGPCGARPTPRRGWAPRARATCSAACSARCSRPASTRWTRVRSAPWSTAWRRTGPTPAARCGSARWRGAYRRPSRRCCGTPERRWSAGSCGGGTEFGAPQSTNRARQSRLRH